MVGTTANNAAVGARADESELGAELAVVNGASPNVPSGLVALCLLARLHRVAAEPVAVMHQLGKSASEPWTTSDLLLAAKHLGLKAKLTRTDLDRLPSRLCRPSP